MIQRIEEKMGTKRSVLVDEKGLPLAVILDGANRHDIKLLQATLEHIIVDRPEATPLNIFAWTQAIWGAQSLSNQGGILPLTFYG